MKYNRLNKEIEITLSDLCGHASVPDKIVGADSLIYNEIDSRFTSKNISFKYEYNDNVYSINLSIIMREDHICEFVLSDEPKLSPIMHETLISAYAYCNMNGLQSVNIETTVINSDGDVLISDVRCKHTKALEAFFIRKLSDKEPVANMMKQRGEAVLPGSAQIKFPYTSFRRGQKTMIQECYCAMNRGERLFIQAPTGIGKTISTLYPAVRLVGEGKCDKIFYLTAKGSTQNEVFRTAGTLFEAGAHLRTIVLSAKDQMCFGQEHMVEGVCDSSDCMYSRASDESFLKAINTLLALQNGYEKNVILKVAKEQGVCPYELSLRLSEYCEIIIADYNYVFDPLVYLRRFFDDQSRTDKYLFLIDEAHNLADRTREMYSAELSYAMFYDLFESVRDILPELSSELKSVMKEIKRLRELCSDSIIVDDKSKTERGYYLSRNHYEALDKKLEALYETLSVYVKKSISEPYYKVMIRPHRMIRKYLVSSALCAENSMFYCEVAGERIMFKTLCVDPAAIIDMHMRSAHATLLFSATLTPTDYFIDILGGGAKSRSLTIKSPFDEENLFIAAVDDISTRYEDRDKSLLRVVSYIAAAVSCRKGNYMVYFPSYDYMNKAAEVFGEKYPGVKLLLQKRKMTREERNDYLNEFRLCDGKMRVGFCVLGGGFSEGIDLPGSSLIGAVVVGVGTPGISGERNIMRDYFDVTREMGYHYAYTYPGMNNVLQAAGRVIRSNTDCGIVVLIDDRYATPQYKAIYPEHWHDMKHFSQPISLNAAIKAFWGEISEKNAKNMH